jgi:molybdenum cofactor cytidylyltransferase
LPTTTSNTGIIVLAAGASTRLGSPKQLLLHKGKSLLKHAVEEAMNSQAKSVVVVLGANAGILLKEINETRVTLVKNAEWQEGMASSIRAGLNTLIKNSVSAEAVILMVCDQPFVSAAVLNDLISTQQKTGKSIVACNYGEAIGPPALFHQSLFDELIQLEGDVGARKIILQHSGEVATVYFPQGKIDIDTEADYNALL